MSEPKHRNTQPKADVVPLQQGVNPQRSAPANPAADEIVNLALKRGELIRDEQGTTYCSIVKDPQSADGKKGFLRVFSRDFQRWLRYEVYAQLKGIPKASAIKDAVQMLDAMAAYKGSSTKLFKRFAFCGDTIYLGLGPGSGRAVKIGSDGWEVIDNPPVHFLYSPTALDIPEPARGGSLGEFSKLLNLGYSDFVLTVGWVTMAMRGKGPYPVLNLVAPQGGAKSTITLTLRTLIDPVTVPLIGPPSSVRDLDVVAQANPILCLNNMSEINADMSDALCRISTEGGASKRRLYSDADEVVLETNRPIIVNGISPVATRGDLVERSVFINPAEISPENRRSQSELQEEFEAKRPFILGAVLDCVVDALRDHRSVKLDKTPRMADFARWGEAATRRLCAGGESFSEIYQRNQDETVLDNAEGSETAMAVVKFMAALDSWEGKTSELLNELRKCSTGDFGKLPATVCKLRDDLRRIKPILRRHDIDWEQGQRTATQRKIRLYKAQ